MSRGRLPKTGYPTMDFPMRPDTPLPVYQICLHGHLDERWLRWLEGLSMTHTPDGETILYAAMDQAALYGLLARIRDLGLELISVQRIAQD